MRGGRPHADKKRTENVGVLCPFFDIELLAAMAQIAQRAFLAFRGACRADLATEPNNAMAKITLLCGLDQRNQCALHLDGVLAIGGHEAEPPADADAVGVCDDGGLFVNVAQQQIGDLPTDAGEFQKLVHLVGKRAAVIALQHGAGGLDIGGLGAEQTARTDDVFNVGDRRVAKALGIRVSPKQLAANDIDALFRDSADLLS